MDAVTDLAAVEAALVEHFGQTPARASISFVGVEPIEVLRFEPVPGERAYVSLGMSRHPMVGADELVRSNSGPRAELALHLRDPQDRFGDVWRRVALLAAAPAVEGVVYAPGLSVDLGEPLTAGSACTGVLVDTWVVAPVEIAGSPVEVFQAVPATSSELAWCRVRGADALRERWSDQQVDLLDLGRAGASLD